MYTEQALLKTTLNESLSYLLNVPQLLLVKLMRAWHAVSDDHLVACGSFKTSSLPLLLLLLTMIGGALRLCRFTRGGGPS